MKLLSPTKENLETAAKAIKSGLLVAFPTETVYGLGADGFNPTAVAKIYEVKQRPEFQSLSLMLPDKSYIKEVAEVENEKAIYLIEKFLPGPLTLVLPKKESVPDIVTGGKATVGIRIPENRIALDLLHLAGIPVAAPSANLYGKLSPTSAEHVAEQLGESVDFIIDGGETRLGLESTIIEIVNNTFTLLRNGGIPVEEIEKAIDEKIFPARTTSANKTPALNEIKTAFIDEVNLDNIEREKTGLLTFTRKNIYGKFSVVKHLSNDGNLEEAAVNLFAVLRSFEKEDIDLLLVEKIPQGGLGRAIMDRLRKITE